MNQQNLIAKADAGLRPSRKRPMAKKVLDAADLSQLFGIDIAQSEPARHRASTRSSSSRTSSRASPRSIPRDKSSS